MSSQTADEKKAGSLQSPSDVEVDSGSQTGTQDEAAIAPGPVTQVDNGPRMLLKDQTQSNIAWIGSIQAFLLIVIGVFSGPLFDMGYFEHLIIGGSFLVVFGTMMTSLSTQYWQVMLAQGITMGLGVGCLFTPSVAIVSTYFTTKKALATGIAATGSSIGGVIYTVAFARLQPTIGFPWATRVLGFLSLAGLLVSISVMRVRTKPAAKRKMFAFNAFKEFTFTFFTISQFFGILGIWVPFFFIQTYAIEHGIDSSFAFYLLTILNAGSVFGRVVPNYFADKIGPLNIMIIACFVSSLLSFCWIAVNSKAGIIVFCILYGFFSGSFVSLPAPTIASLSPNMSVVGARMGTSFAVAGFGILLGSPIGGVILRSSGWVGLQCWGAATIALSTILAIMARIHRQPKLLGKV
ncbi:major facilitator superfamily domain-containing protein [Bombardia bombarda]|uniref:Major facilitator superfamily domain-containing protein n=1 Tax=Bombardia bombarda TaxID=252184 RepID=A0AA39WH34_9PEZI|nr:major facilitator superfamily domain-containing protein [Bombardia bombarda]